VINQESLLTVILIGNMDDVVYQNEIVVIEGKVIDSISGRLVVDEFVALGSLFFKVCKVSFYFLCNGNTVLGRGKLSCFSVILNLLHEAKGGFLIPYFCCGNHGVAFCHPSSERQAFVQVLRLIA